MKSFKCANCPCVFREDEAKIVEDDMGVTDPYPIYKRFLACPSCSSEDLFEFEYCDVCDEAEAVKGYDGMCVACFNATLGEKP